MAVVILASPNTCGQSAKARQFVPGFLSRVASRSHDATQRFEAGLNPFARHGDRGEPRRDHPRHKRTKEPLRSCGEPQALKWVPASIRAPHSELWLCQAAVMARHTKTSAFGLLIVSAMRPRLFIDHSAIRMRLRPSCGIPSPLSTARERRLRGQSHQELYR
jgi:hypothetical protein